jgi:hypothetical protein
LDGRICCAAPFDSRERGEKPDNKSRHSAKKSCRPAASIRRGRAVKWVQEKKPMVVEQGEALLNGASPVDQACAPPIAKIR